MGEGNNWRRRELATEQASCGDVAEAVRGGDRGVYTWEGKPQQRALQSDATLMQAAGRWSLGEGDWRGAGEAGEAGGVGVSSSDI